MFPIEISMSNLIDEVACSSIIENGQLDFPFPEIALWEPTLPVKQVWEHKVNR